MAIRSPLHPDHQIFLLIAEKLNISKAAEAMGVGQSGLSKAIRRLETEVGGSLFARRNQGVELTREGLALLKALKSCQIAWSSSYDLHTQNQGVEGSFTFGGHSSVLSVYLPVGLSHLLKTYPKLDIQVQPGTSLETTRKVAALKLDFGIVVNFVKAADLVAKKINTDFLAVWKLKNSHPRWICYSPEMIDSGKLLRRTQGRRLVAIPDYATIYEMVLHGESEAILPSSLIRHPEVQMSGKKLRAVTVSLIYHRDNARSSAYQAIASTWKTKDGIN